VRISRSTAPWTFVGLMFDWRALCAVYGVRLARGQICSLIYRLDWFQVNLQRSVNRDSLAVLTLPTLPRGVLALHLCTVQKWNMLQPAYGKLTNPRYLHLC
jgi:hypothetical protein